MTSSGKTPYREAEFIERLNRFVARVNLDGEIQYEYRCGNMMPGKGVGLRHLVIFFQEEVQAYINNILVEVHSLLVRYLRQGVINAP